MEFLKKHYEKILLGIVLALAIGAFASLPVIIGIERHKLDEMRQAPTRVKIPDLAPLDLNLESNTLARIDAGQRWDYTKDHNVFNPVVWLKDQRNVLIKMHPGQELDGPGMLEVTNIRPLSLRLHYNGMSGTNTYQIGYTNDAVPGYASHGERTVSLGGKGDMFILNQIVGPPENPTELHVEIVKTPGQMAVVGPGKDFERVVGYAADLKYPPETRTFTNQREGGSLSLSGVRYKIVAITQTNVVVSAPNDRHYPINFHAVPK